MTNPSLMENPCLAPAQKKDHLIGRRESSKILICYKDRKKGGI